MRKKITWLSAQLSPSRLRRHDGFEVHVKAFSDAVDVVEEGDDLRRVADGAIGKPLSAKGVDVVGAHRLWRFRQLHGVVAQRAVDGGKFGGAVVRFDRVNPFGVVDLGPEVVGVGFRSVVTVVGTRNDHREHFPLGARQRRFALHARDVQPEHSLERRGTLALDSQDIVDPPGTLASILVNPSEQPLGLGFLDAADPGHVCRPIAPL